MITKIFRLIRAKLILAFYRTFHREGNLVKTRVNNYEMYVPASDKGIGEQLIVHHTREQRAAAEYRSKMKDNEFYLDLGANLGYYVLMIAKNVKNAQILAIEPNKSSVEILKKNLELNGVSNVEILNAAAGNKEGYATLYVGDYCNASRMLPNGGSNKVEVPMLKLDSRQITRKPLMFRMDTEGYESEIMKGGQKFFSGEFAPDNLFIEVHPPELKQLGTSNIEFFELLDSYGYEPYLFIYQSNDFCSGDSKYAEFHSWEEYKANPRFDTVSAEVFFRRK